uniref:Uncharacterized protein n=1 Tax=Aplanochytrium stocchinoi TaxID=215587 RepID=A0A7S3LK64_9STRA
MDEVDSAARHKILNINISNHDNCRHSVSQIITTYQPRSCRADVLLKTFSLATVSLEYLGYLLLNAVWGKRESKWEFNMDQTKLSRNNEWQIKNTEFKLTILYKH